jgi:hypothetical protein
VHYYIEITGSAELEKQQYAIWHSALDLEPLECGHPFFVRSFDWCDKSRGYQKVLSCSGVAGSPEQRERETWAELAGLNKHERLFTPIKRARISDDSKVV